MPKTADSFEVLLEATLTVLKEMDFYEARIKEELQKNLPFLASTVLLIKAIGNGVGRENMHQIIKEHAVAIAENLRQGKSNLNEFANCLAEDHRFPLSLKEIDAVLNDHANLSASATEQAEKFANSVEKWTIRFPEAKEILPKELL